MIKSNQSSLDIADHLSRGEYDWCPEAETRLKEQHDQIYEQQAEIEALKKDNKELHAIAQRMAMAESDARKSLQWFKDAKERQNEPVAWMNEHGEISQEEHWAYPTPLYTHPAKTLTDEEILNVAFCCEVHTVSIENDWDGTVIDFARAILRKAQEK